MKKFVSVLLLLVFISGIVFSQDSDNEERNLSYALMGIATGLWITGIIIQSIRYSNYDSVQAENRKRERNSRGLYILPGIGIAKNVIFIGFSYSK
jgi:hypothetical protein